MLFMKERQDQQFWQRYYNDFKSSGLNQTNFCKLHNLNRKNFSRWKQRFENMIEVKPTEPTFIEVPVVQTKQNYFDLIIKDSIKIRITKSFDSELLQRIIKALKGI